MLPAPYQTDHSAVHSPVLKVTPYESSLYHHLLLHIICHAMKADQAACSCCCNSGPVLCIWRILCTCCNPFKPESLSRLTIRRLLEPHKDFHLPFGVCQLFRCVTAHCLQSCCLWRLQRLCVLTAVVSKNVLDSSPCRTKHYHACT